MHYLYTYILYLVLPRRNEIQRYYVLDVYYVHCTLYTSHNYMRSERCDKKFIIFRAHRKDAPV